MDYLLPSEPGRTPEGRSSTCRLRGCARRGSPDGHQVHEPPGTPAPFPGQFTCHPDFGAIGWGELLGCCAILVQLASRVLTMNECAIFEAQTVAAKPPLQQALHAERTPDQRVNLG